MKYKEVNDKNGKKATQKKAPGRMTKAKKKALRRKKFRRGVLIFVSVLLLLCIGAGYGGYRLMDSLQPARNEKTIEALSKRKLPSDLVSDSSVKNILLLGLDSRKSNGTGLSDTIMLISVNSKTKVVTMVSFLRDMWVEIPGKGSAKINAAASWGGVPLAVETIEHNFKIKIDDYVLVTFDAFKKAVDAMDGVNLPLTKAEAAEMKRYSKGKTDLPAGESVFMNGSEALLYARIRKQDDDWQRTNRQRTVLTAIADKAKDQPLKAFKALQGVMEYFETDMQTMDLLKLIGANPEIYKYEIKSEHIPWGQNGGMWSYKYIAGQSAISPDIPKNRAKLQELIYS